ncbi:10885_t:CDS:2 [Racocetra persica]|uniref:10885_t:CDS:1 n=1 Tax=Racocetra persica TaxID=160502 RepID=A0ACA9MH28_9GLOM|nr:10885_t:CDS:2 [Racocetra persica]
MKLLVVISAFMALSLTVNAAPMGLEKRRFGQEHTPAADKTFQDVKDLAQGTENEAEAGNLSGAMVRALLAKAPACDQQDRADEIIDLSERNGIKGTAKQQQLIEVAKTYRQLERNTPNAGQPSELCDKAPRHSELDGLTQAQDPTGAKGNNPKGDNPKGDNPKGDDPKDDPKKKKPKKDDKKKKPKKDDKKKKPKKDDKKKKPKKDDPKGDNPKGTDPADPQDQNVAETNPVGGVAMPKIQNVGGERPFVVNGDSFVNIGAAHTRQCDVQHNLCFNKFNGGDRSFSGQDCDAQNENCKAGPPVLE